MDEETWCDRERHGECQSPPQPAPHLFILLIHSFQQLTHAIDVVHDVIVYIRYLFSILRGTLKSYLWHPRTHLLTPVDFPSISKFSTIIFSLKYWKPTQPFSRMTKCPIPPHQNSFKALETN